jgi:hypothetical protein
MHSQGRWMFGFILSGQLLRLLEGGSSTQTINL